MERERPDSQKQHRADTPVAPTMASTQNRPRPTRDRLTGLGEKEDALKTPMCNADMADVMTLYPGRRKKKKEGAFPDLSPAFPVRSGPSICMHDLISFSMQLDPGFHRFAWHGADMTHLFYPLLASSPALPLSRQKQHSMAVFRCFVKKICDKILLI